MEIGAGGGIQPAEARSFDRASLPTQGHRSPRFVEAWAGVPAFTPTSHLAESGTEGRTTGLQGFMRPCVPPFGRGDPPGNETAAPTGVKGGSQEIGKLAGYSVTELYRLFPILAIHFGLEGGL